jgi:hypothetical protein
MITYATAVVCFRVSVDTFWFGFMLIIDIVDFGRR